MFLASQEAIRYAVHNHQQKEKLQSWLESGTPLKIEAEFHLGPRIFHQSDLDSLFSDLLNPLVEGACGPRPMGKPIPQTKDILRVKERLGHKRIDSTLLYIQLAETIYGEGQSDEFISKTAEMPKEVCELIESGFEYVTEMDGLRFFRKRK